MQKSIYQLELDCLRSWRMNGCHHFLFNRLSCVNHVYVARHFMVATKVTGTLKKPNVESGGIWQLVNENVCCYRKGGSKREWRVALPVVYRHLPLVGTTIFKKRKLKKMTKLDNANESINARSMGTSDPLWDFGHPCCRSISGLHMSHGGWWHRRYLLAMFYTKSIVHVLRVH